MSNDYSDWARRHASKGGSGGAADPLPAAAPIPQAAAPMAPPPPPAGYTWAWNGQALVLVPLAPQMAPPPQPAYYAAPPPPAWPAPHQPPGTVPWTPQAAPAHVPGHGVVRPAPIKSCELVRPGNRDLYAELMATVPDLVPYDPSIVPGQMSASTQAEIQAARGQIEGESGRPMLQPDDGMQAFPAIGRGALANGPAAPLPPQPPSMELAPELAASTDAKAS